MMNMKKLAVATAVAAVFVATSVANAALISVSFERADQGVPDPSTYVGPGGGAGTTWNVSTASSGAGLLDSGGAVTGVGFASTSGLDGADRWDTPDLGMLWTGLRTFGNGEGNSQQFKINGLNVGDSYNLWIASANCLDNNSQYGAGEWFTPNTTTTVGNQVVSNIGNVNGTTWEQGNNFVLFENVVADGCGEIVINGFNYVGTGFDVRLPLNGFQIVESIPEPGTMSLMALALAGVALLKIRKRS